VVGVLTLDLGTSATKAALWNGSELVSIGRAEIESRHPRTGWVEQDPRHWWTSVVEACATARAAAPGTWDRIDAVSFSAARETFALFDAMLAPIGRGIVWSDARADDQVAALGTPADFRTRTGVVAGANTTVAKLLWLAAHAPELVGPARWALAPRDWVQAKLTGVVVTDPTLASRTGLYAIDGRVAEGIVPPAVAALLPPTQPSTSSVPAARPDACAALGLRPGIPVVLGAGDRACEVLGAAATAREPMVSWGTTANVSIPHEGPVDSLPAVATVSRGARGGYLVECGLSASGAAIAWLARLSGREHDELLDAAALVEPGSDGLFALPWLHGARAPWFRPDAHAAFFGIDAGHGAPEMARAIVEAVALDAARSIELIAPEARALTLAGAGSARPLWRHTLAAAAGLPVVRRAVGDAASVGARLLVADALGESVGVGDLSPVTAREEPDPTLVRVLGTVRRRSDREAAAILGGPGGG
jgi:sugar (pentulose or hexulose) kinase